MLQSLGSELQQTNKNKFIRCTIIMLVTNSGTDKTVRCRILLHVLCILLNVLNHWICQLNFLNVILIIKYVIKF